MGNVVRDTRRGMGLNQRDFSAELRKSLASGCTLGSISHWERGRNQLIYEKAFYIWLHTESSELRNMAAAVMAEQNPAWWEADKQKYERIWGAK